MKIVFFLISSFAQFSSVYAQESQNYDYQTKLKGGYNISFKEKGDMQYLYLVKGRRIIAELSSASKGLLQKNLGYVGADFDEYFVLVQSFGSGNPHWIEIIYKRTGKTFLKRQDFGLTFIKNERLFYLVFEKFQPRKTK